jgi:hypothetical protein
MSFKVPRGVSAPACIYTRPNGLCLGVSALTDEHFLPRGFGRFRGYAPIQDKICGDCNGHFSKLDEVLLRHSPEALMRAGHGIRGRKKHRPKDLFHERSQGFPPIELSALLPNDTSPTRLEVIEGGVAQPRRELIFESEDQKRTVVPVPHSINTLDSLNEHLMNYGVLGPRWPRMYVNCSADDSEFVAMLERRFGKIESGTPEPDRSAYPTTVQAVTLINLPPEYHRAIAKIALHFFISCFAPPLVGFESDFDEIKRFIYVGGDPEKFITCGVGSAIRGARACPWAHILAAGWSENEMIASVQLFHGSRLGLSFVGGSKTGERLSGNMKDQAMIWFVRIGRTKLLYPWRKAFAFIGYEQKQNGFDGEVRELRPTNGSSGQFWSME